LKRSIISKKTKKRKVKKVIGGFEKIKQGLAFSKPRPGLKI
jgi:hypothetical protein